MKAPEKIYLYPYSTDGIYEVETKPLEGTVEYTRTDGFIEKAKKWFEKQNGWFDPNGNRHCDMEDFKDFRNYMEGVNQPLEEKGVLVKHWAYVDDLLTLSNLETTKEPKKCMYSKDDYTDEDRKVLCDGCKEKCEYSKSDDFTKALAECIHHAQGSVVDPMAHAEIWKDELIKLAKSKEPVSDSETVETQNKEVYMKPHSEPIYLGIGGIPIDAPKYLCKEEPVSDDFTKALAECIHKAQWNVVDPLVLAETWKDELIKLAKSEEPVSEDLDVIAREYAGIPCDAPKDLTYCVHDKKAKYDAVLFGAQWQKQQLIQNAIKGLVVCDDELTHGYKDIVMNIPDNLQVNDEVKLIIIKED